MEDMDDDLVVATTPPSICDNDYGFMIMVKPTKNTVALSLQDICEPEENSTELTSLSRRAIYAAVNKKINGLDVTPASHSLSDSSKYIMDDDQLQKVLAFEKQYVRIFRWILNPTPQAFVNEYHHEQNVLSNAPNPQDITMISPPTTICKPTSSILSHAAAKFPDAQSNKHEQLHRPTEQGATKKLKEFLKIDDSDDGEESVNVKAIPPSRKTLQIEIAPW